MKKIITILVILIAIFTMALIIVPFAFKGTINTILLKKVNQSVNASINYGNYKVSLLKSFPDLNVAFSDVSIVGVNDFNGDILASFSMLSAEIDLMSLLKKEGIIIKSVKLDNGVLNLIENANGNVNWDINKEQLQIEKTNNANIDETTDKTPIKLLLNNVLINNFKFEYNSFLGNYSFSIDSIGGSLRGEMKGLKTLFDVKVNTPLVNLSYDSISYIKNGKVDLTTQLEADLNNFDFIFKKGSSLVNGLPVNLDGGFNMPNDSINFNMFFDVPEIKMNQLLSQMPNAYKKYLKDVEADGNVTLKGEITGIYFKDIYPKLNLNFTISDGVVKYPELPDELKINELQAQIYKPEGAFDLMTLGISNLDMHLAQNPFKMHAFFSSLFTDPFIDVVVDGIVDMGTLSKVIPLGNTKIEGLLTADATIKGNYSALDSNNFTSFVSVGSIDLKNFHLQNNTLPQGISISNAALVLKNQEVNVNGLRGQIGRSDFALKGKLQNIISYLFASDELIGRFELNSELLDLNEFMKSYKPAVKPENEVYVQVDTTIVNNEPLIFPENVSMDFDAQIKRLLFDKLDITDFRGELILKEQNLALKGLTMGLVGGQLKMNGTILADGRPSPHVNFNLNVLNFDLPTAYKQISFVQKYMPFAAKSQGKFSTLLKVKSELGTNFKMILSSVSANGTFSTLNLKLVDAVFFSNLKSVVKYEKLRNLEVDDFKTTYSIEDGNLNIQPLNTKLANQPVRLEGTYNLGGTLNFRVDAGIDKELLSNEIQNMIVYIPGHQNLKKVDVGLNISGDAKKPDVSVDTDKIKKQVLDQIKNSSKEDIENAAKKFLKDLFK